MLVEEFEMICCTFGGKMGNSGCRREAMRSRSTTFACGRVVKYVRFYEVSMSNV